ncbi:MAG: Quinolinate synthetase protein, partial [bacterium]
MTRRTLPRLPEAQIPGADVAALQAQVRALAQERDATILAHNYQLPEIQDV